MDPIEFILNCPDEIKKGNVFKQFIYIFESNAINECTRIESIIYRYHGNKYQKIKSEIIHEINQIKSMAKYILIHVINTPQSKIVSVFIQSFVLTLYKVLVLVLVKILKVKYNISDLEKDLEKDFRSCVGFLCWFLTMD